MLPTIKIIIDQCRVGNVFMLPTIKNVEWATWLPTLFENNENELSLRLLRLLRYYFYFIKEPITRL